MTRQKKVGIVLSASLLIGVAFFWLRPQEPWKLTGAAATDSRIGLSSATRAASESTESPSTTGSVNVAVDVNSTAAKTKGANVASNTGLGWSKAVAIRDTKWAIEQLSISNDPNDRLRAYALSVICANILLRPLDTYKSSFEARKKTLEQQREITQMRDDMQSRCGSSESGNPYLPSSATTQGMRSARAAQVPLAIALDTSFFGAAKAGLAATDADALSVVMKDESLRSAWLSKSLMGGLAQELSATPNFSDVPADEMTAALMTVLCRSGDECGAESVYRPYLCFTSSFRFCTGTTIVEAIAAELGPGSAVRFENAVRRLQAAFAAGDLEALGFHRRNL